jgi:hypothetical protein
LQHSCKLTLQLQSNPAVLLVHIQVTLSPASPTAPMDLLASFPADCAQGACRSSGLGQGARRLLDTSRADCPTANTTPLQLPEEFRVPAEADPAVRWPLWTDVQARAPATAFKTSTAWPPGAFFSWRTAPVSAHAAIPTLQRHLLQSATAGVCQPLAAAIAAGQGSSINDNRTFTTHSNLLSTASNAKLSHKILYQSSATLNMMCPKTLPFLRPLCLTISQCL